MKKLLIINLMLCALIGSALVFAQSQSPPTEDGCRRFKTPVQQAPADLDKSMLVTENNTRVRALGKVIDPCRSASLPVRVKPTAVKPFQIQPAAPKFSLVTPSPAPKLKTPSEVLRDTLKPKQP